MANFEKKLKRAKAKRNEFYRLFVCVDGARDKQEVYAKHTSYAEAIKVANEFKKLDVSVTMLSGTPPTKIAYKFVGNNKALRF